MDAALLIEIAKGMGIFGGDVSVPWIIKAKQSSATVEGTSQLVGSANRKRVPVVPLYASFQP